jgi:alkyl sulfatase BDS1-like metallo-beta-lactamase superfamily hydrolase
MGGIDRVVELAQRAFDDGDFRWAATLLDHATFTDAAHTGARELYADTFEQLAYGAENATWRNFFLAGANELRDGNFGTPTQTTSLSLVSQLTPEQMFDSFAISINGPRAWDLDLAIDITFLDVATNYRLTLRNGVLVHRAVAADPSTASATVTLANKLRLLAFAAGDAASVAPAASKSVRFARLRLALSVTWKPLASRFFAMPWPIMPMPMKPIFRETMVCT